MRPIDADALFKKVKTECNPYGKPTIGFEDGKRVMSWIKQAPTIGGWISVNDRMPEEKENPLTLDFTEVICFCDFGGRPKRTDIRIYRFGKRCDENEPHFWNGPSIMDGVVTHWMPFPELPEEVSGDA